MFNAYIPEKYHARRIIQTLDAKTEGINPNKNKIEFVIGDEQFYEKYVLSNIGLLDITPGKKKRNRCHRKLYYMNLMQKENMIIV